MSSKSLSNIDSQKKKYIFLLGLVIVGIIFGIVFSLIISKSDKVVVDNNVIDFFSNIKNNNINYSGALKESLLSNILYLSITWLLGMSIIGLPIVIFILFMRGFILGFSIGSIIRIYKFKGTLAAFLYIFPHNIIMIIISILLSFYAINFSLKLFRFLFFHNNINFKSVMGKYFKTMIFCLIGYVICSLIEVFISPYILNIFNIFIK